MSVEHIPVSVIVPIYNVEQYVEACAESLFSQTIKNIEFIFIDDCTPDNSIDILNTVLDKFPRRKNQVRILRMECNSGLAAVRARGLKEAQGDYIINCDSDDWVEPQMYEKMYEVAKSKDADVVICNVALNYPNKEVPDLDYHESGSGFNDICNIYHRHTKPHTYTVNKLIRRELITQNQIYPISGANLWEDVNYTLRVLYHAKHIVKIDDYLYHYRQNQSSICYSIGKTIEGYEIKKKVVRFLEDYFDREGVQKEMRNTLNYYKLLSKMSLLNRHNIKRWREEFPEAHENIEILTSFSNRERKKMNLALSQPSIFIVLEYVADAKSNVKRLIKKFIRR